MKFKSGQLVVTLSVALLLGACAGGPTLTEREFGDSVRQMITAQTHDPSTLESPAEGAKESTDGEMLRGALEGYRSTVADQGEVGTDLRISLE